MRRGQQQISLSVNQCEQLCNNYITPPADLLRDNTGELPLHKTVESTLEALAEKLPSWFKLFDSTWELCKGRELIPLKAE